MKLNKSWILAPAIIIPTTVNAVQYLSTEQAQKIIFPEANKFEALIIAGLKPGKARLDIFRVENDAGMLGYFIINEVIGKHEYITYAMGINLHGQVSAVEIMDYRESIGDQVRDFNWRKQFTGKTVQDKFKLGEDVKNISGATYSCKHITEGIARILEIYETKLKT